MILKKIRRWNCKKQINFKIISNKTKYGLNLTYEKLKEGEIENNFQFDKLVHVKQITIKKNVDQI